MRWCVDVLGAPQYADVVFKNVPRSFGLGVFAKEFGDALPFVREAVKRGYKFFRIQLLWSHNNHTYGDSDLPSIKALAPLYNRIVIANPDVAMELSPFCEHVISNPDKYLDFTQKLAPNCRIINSPVRLPNGQKGGISKKYKNEVHGSNAGALSGAYNFSFDGSDAFNSDIEGVKKNLASCENFFLWAPGFNCHVDENDKTRNSPATSPYMKGVLNLINTRGAMALPKGWLIKPMSEKWKPVVIAPIRKPQMVLKKGNKVIAKSLAPMPFVDGRWRYYFNLQGYQLGQCDLWIGNKKYGTADMGFRSGDYR